MKWFFARLREPSTQAGIAAGAIAAQQIGSDPKNIGGWIAGMFSVLAAVSADKGAA